MVTWLQERKSALATALEELQKSENQLKVGTQIIANSEQLSSTISPEISDGNYTFGSRLVERDIFQSRENTGVRNCQKPKLSRSLPA